ncbi:hypothetical protein EEZ25_27150 [Micromonospora aurantiaca]|nr:hypothetical protein EEZ25_27150 [Micromonospora aurantiaca]
MTVVRLCPAPGAIARDSRRVSRRPAGRRWGQLSLQQAPVDGHVVADEVTAGNAVGHLTFEVGEVRRRA